MKKTASSAARELEDTALDETTMLVNDASPKQERMSFFPAVVIAVLFLGITIPCFIMDAISHNMREDWRSFVPYGSTLLMTLLVVAAIAALEWKWTLWNRFRIGTKCLYVAVLYYIAVIANGMIVWFLEGHDLVEYFGSDPEGSFLIIFAVIANGLALLGLAAWLLQLVVQLICLVIRRSRPIPHPITPDDEGQEETVRRPIINQFWRWFVIILSAEVCCLLAFIIVAETWPVPGKWIVLGLAFSLVSFLLFLASGNLNLNRLWSLSAALSLGFLICFDGLAYLRFSGLAKDVILFSPEYIVRATVKFGLLFVGHGSLATVFCGLRRIKAWHNPAV